MSDSKRMVVIEGFIRHYRGDPQEDAHRPYSNLLHDPKTDERFSIHDTTVRVLNQIPEGNIVRIVVEDTGERAELADDWWCLLEPHKYGPHSALPAPSD